MRRVVYVAVVLVAALVVWAVVPEEPRVERALEAPAPAAAVPREQRGDVTIPAPEHELVVAPPAAVERVEAAVATPPGTPPRDARGELVIQVLADVSGAPLAGAKVALRNVRRKAGPLAELADVSSPERPVRTDVFVTTDARGEAEYGFGAWRDGVQVDEASILVEHADHISLATTVPIAWPSSRAVVRMKPCMLLVVSGWIEDPSNVKYDVVPKTSTRLAIAPAEWRTSVGGRLAARCVMPGAYSIAITWRSPSGETFESDVLPFRTVAGETKELALELHPHVALRGRVHESVPRPIVNGEIAINVDFGGRGVASALREQRATIDPDGSFHFASLPRGRAQYVAACAGWVTSDVPATDWFDAGFGATRSNRPVPSDGTPRSSNRPSPLIHPHLTLPYSGDLVVPMQRTASLEIEVVDEAGAPVQGARIELAPTIEWRVGGSSPWFERFWFGTSDDRGRVRLDDLPPAASIPARVTASHRALVDERGEHADSITVELVPGATAEHRAVVAPYRR